jgi:hypothetical protein
MVGGLAVGSAAAVAMLMVLSPMGGAVSALAFPHATVSLSWSNYQTGCAAGKITKPAISLTTGVGKASMKSTAKTCPILKGGKAVTSYADDSTGLGITENLKLTKAATQVNVSYDIVALAMAAAVGTLPRHCPVTHYSFSYVSSNTTVSFNENYSYCASEASWSIYIEPEVYDATTGMYASSFGAMSNVSGNYYSSYSYSYNYSNPYYTNVTYAGTSSQTWGGPYSTSIAWAPSAIMTGSWSVGDHLIIYAQVYIYTYAQIQGEGHGSATAAFLASGTSGHVDITGITIT